MTRAAIAAAMGGRVIPFRVAPRIWNGNMCGDRVPGLPPVPGGAADPSLVLSWFYDRYGPTFRRVIRQTWTRKGRTHVLLSWPDSQATGFTPLQFKATCEELAAAGFSVCVMLSAKPTSSAEIRTVEETLANILLVLPLLVGLVPLFSVGWELNLWLSPEDLQVLINAIAPVVLRQPGTRLGVHFSEGVSSWQVNGLHFADFWNTNIGKLAFLLHQKILAQTPDQYYFDSGGLVDVLIRFAGNDFVSPDSGFGHPFDLVACEITAMDQFNGTVSEAQGDAYGRWAMAAPAQMGPAGAVGVMGSNNGR